MIRRAPHLVSFLLLLSALLYGGGVARASEAGPPPGADAVAPHLALLLPTGSEAFAEPARAVHAGFMEAWKKEVSHRLPVRLYPIDEDPRNVVAAYRKALAAGARMVVGPLTRNGVTALAGTAGLISVPTLALNVPEHLAARPPQFFMLSLQVEAEAQQIAKLALGEGRRKALTVSDPTPLARRMREAFAEEFTRGGGHHLADYSAPTDAAELERLRHAASLGVADMVFLATGAAQLRALAPVVSALPGYGTSQLNPGLTPTAPQSDVPNVRFVDMPWMIQPDHPAVMIYDRAGGAPRADDMERLYALGIDAFRVAHALLGGSRTIDIDGVTGHLTLGPDGQLRRGLLATLIDRGRLTVLGETRP